MVDDPIVIDFHRYIADNQQQRSFTVTHTDVGITIEIEAALARVSAVRVAAVSGNSIDANEHSFCSSQQSAEALINGRGLIDIDTHHSSQHNACQHSWRHLDHAAYVTFDLTHVRHLRAIRILNYNVDTSSQHSTESCAVHTSSSPTLDNQTPFSPLIGSLSLEQSSDFQLISVNATTKFVRFDSFRAYDGTTTAALSEIQVFCFKPFWIISIF